MLPSARLKTVISLALAIAVLVVFLRVGGYDFIDYDDGSYVFKNAYVLKGWSLEGLKWAFTTNLHLHWHPLTWLSLMTDNQLFGVNPGAYHLVNLLIHLLSTLLLFFVLNRMTGAVYCSAFVAALFGLHPLHVEPVAWIADRKDLLSAFFWITTLWAYLKFVRKPGPGNAVLVLVSFICSLMSKSMSVTLPLVLLVMDFWPLKRFSFQKQASIPDAPPPAATKPSQTGKKGGKKGERKQILSVLEPVLASHWATHSIGRLLLEKSLLVLPMIVGAIISLTVIHGEKTHSIDASRALPTLDTLAGAIVGYAHYLYQVVWPAGLAIPYPQVKEFPLWEIFLSLGVVLGLSFLAYRRRMQNPYLLAGWLWYLITLLPVIGLVQSGPHIQADRYTYIPLVGIFVMIAWGARDFLKRSPNREWILGTAAAASIVCCMAVSYAQVGRWENTITIFSHSAEVTENNTVALNNLGLNLLGSGKTDEAMSYLLEAVKINPNDTYAQVNLGNAYKSKNDLEKAAYHYEKALSIDAKYANASYNLANIYLQWDKLELCRKYFLQTIENDPQSHMAHTNLGAAYSRMGRSGEAIAQYQESIQICPDQHLAYYGLGLEYMKTGNLDRAEINFRRVLEYKPDYERAHFDLGTVMMRRNEYDKAIRHFAAAVEINPRFEKARQSLEQAQKANLSRSGSQ